MQARRAGNPPENMQKLLFEVPTGEMGERDRAIII